MKIVINHVTRMAYPYACVAGIDIETGNHVRPVLFGRLGREWVDDGGIFQLGEIVDLGQVSAVGNLPEIEDRRFEPRALRRLGPMRPSRFWAFLERCAAISPSEIFGPDIQPVSAGYACDTGCGSASLGCLRPTQQPSIFISPHGGARLRLEIDGETRFLPVTDRRCHAINNGDYVAAPNVVDALQARIKDGDAVVLSVGLGRAFRRHSDDRPRHWLQVNNIHLNSAPLWTPQELLAQTA